MFVADDALLRALEGVDLAEICITSDIGLSADRAPADAFALADVAGVSVVSKLAEGKKCARSGGSPRMSAAIQRFPPCPCAMRRRCARVRSPKGRRLSQR